MEQEHAGGCALGGLCGGIGAHVGATRPGGEGVRGAVKAVRVPLGCL